MAKKIKKDNIMLDASFLSCPQSQIQLEYSSVKELAAGHPCVAHKSTIADSALPIVTKVPVQDAPDEPDLKECCRMESGSHEDQRPSVKPSAWRSEEHFDASILDIL